MEAAKHCRVIKAIVANAKGFGAAAKKQFYAVFCVKFFGCHYFGLALRIHYVFVAAKAKVLFGGLLGIGKGGERKPKRRLEQNARAPR